MRPLCWMKIVSLVRLPWMMGGSQECRKLRSTELPSGHGQCPAPWEAGQQQCQSLPESRQDLGAPALPGLEQRSEPSIRPDAHRSAGARAGHSHLPTRGWGDVPYTSPEETGTKDEAHDNSLLPNPCSKSTIKAESPFPAQSSPEPPNSSGSMDTGGKAHCGCGFHAHSPGGA